MTPTELTPKAVAALTVDSEPYLSCDDCFDQADAAIEGLLETGTALTAPFRVHLHSCAACHDEALGLATFIAQEHGMTAEEALQRLEAQVETAA